MPCSAQQPGSAPPNTVTSARGRGYGSRTRFHGDRIQVFMSLNKQIKELKEIKVKKYIWNETAALYFIST